MKAYLFGDYDAVNPLMVRTDAPRDIVREALSQDAEDDEQYGALVRDEIKGKGFKCEFEFTEWMF